MNIAAHSRGNRTIYTLYLMLLAWAPIPLGSNRVWAWSFLEAIIYLLVATIAIVSMVSGKKIVAYSALNHNRLIIAIFGLQLGYLLIQCVPLPAGLLALLSPLKAAWFETEPLIANARFITLSASPQHSMIEFYKQLAYLLMLCLTLCLVDSKKRLFITLSVIISVSILEAVYGVVARLLGDSFTFWRPTDGGLAGGTFVNKNHFAANLSLSVGLSIGLCLYFLRVSEVTQIGGKLRGLVLRLIKLVLTPVGFIFGILLILISGMFLSQSRGALIALFLATLIVLSLGMVRHGRKSLEAKILPPIFLTTLLAAFWLGLGNMFSSFVGLLDTDTSRWTHWQQTWTMFTDHWLSGVGNGAYQFIFTQYKEGDYTKYLIDYAHNDHLQLLAEQGIIGASLWYSALFLCCSSFLSAFRNQRGSRRYQSLLLGCVIALTAFFIHGLVDFNFHIPANALWFYTILGLAMTISRTINRGKWPSE
jgi:putative inorganic carbon (HCO3(-)) transporter